METKESALLKKIKLQIGRKLNTLFVGEYHSAFKGQGLSFESVREYQFGDDIRSVDWNVSARMDHLYIKEYVEERELSVVLMVDISASTDFGGENSKREKILEAVTFFLYLAQMNNDRISIILFTDTVEEYIKPKKGRKFILKVLDEIIKHKAKSKGTNISGAIEFAQKVLKKKSVIFLISDFLEEGSDSLTKLKLLGRKHDIIPVQVFDLLEKEMKFFGLTEFIDLESGKTFVSDMLPEKSNFPELTGFEYISLSSAEPLERGILKFFEKRNRTKLTR